MAAHKLAGAENFVKALDILADQEVLVERLAVPVVDTTCMAAALFGLERSWPLPARAGVPQLGQKLT